MIVKYNPNNKKRSLSFFYRLMLSVIAIILVISLLTSSVSYGLATQVINDIQLQLVKKNAEIIEKEINGELLFVEEFMLETINLDIIRNTAERQSIPEDEHDLTYQSIEYSINKSIRNSSRDDGIKIDILNIYLKNGVVFSTRPEQKLDYHDYDSCNNYLTSTGYIDNSNYIPVTWIETLPIKNSSGNVVQSCFCIRFIYDSISMEKIGIMVVGVDESQISGLYKEIFPEAYIFQNTGNVISSNNNLMIGKDINEKLFMGITEAKQASGDLSYSEEEQENTAIYWRNPYNSIYFVIPMDNGRVLFNEVLLNFLNKSIYVALSAMILGVIASFMLTRNMSKSILSLKETVQKVYQGELKTRYKPIKNDEIAYLGLHINDMLDQIEESYVTRERDAIERNAIELQLFQSQMNPHLLYNTLNSVALAIKSNDSEKAEQLLFKLSSFFKLSLSEGRETITLNTEIEIIRNYIAIQNLARQKNLTLCEDIPEEILLCKILRMSILPVVENSVIHGISGYRNDGVIIIKCSIDKQKGVLLITVRDNGIGIEEDELERLNHSINLKNKASKQKYFGLYNVNWRIKNKWGEKYGIKIKSEISDYTEVEIAIPTEYE